MKRMIQSRIILFYVEKLSTVDKVSGKSLEEMDIFRYRRICYHLNC